MSLQLEKIKTYVGFSIKSRHIVFGTDSILSCKNAKVVMMSTALADSAKSKLMHYHEKWNTPIFVIDVSEFLDIVQNESVKAIAITDSGLASAIKKILTSNGLGGQLE